MTARHDLDRLLAAWLTDEVGPVDAPAYLGETLDLVDRTPQRRAWPWSGVAVPRHWFHVDLPTRVWAVLMVMLLLLALVVAALIGAFRLPPPTPTGPGRIVVTTGDGTLAVINPDGGVDELSRTAGSPTMASVSPDGTLIAYWSWVIETDKDGNDTTTVPLRVRSLDGSGSPITILDGVEPPIGFVEERPQWSLDGRFLALSVGGTIYVVGVDGTGLTALADDGRSDRSAPTWSPDGEWIAFHAAPPATQPVYRPLGDVHVIRPDGTDETAVTRGGSVWRGNFGAQWSADGRRIAYVVTGRPQGLEIASLTGSSWSTARVGDAEGLGDQVMFLWSPVGDRLAYTKETLTTDLIGYHLMLVDADGSIRQVTKDLVSQGFCWSPDATHLVAITLDGGLVTLDVASGEQVADFGMRGLNVGDACVWSAWAGEPR